MNKSEIKALTVNELRDKISTEESNLYKLKFAHAISPIENPMQIRESRRLVARLKTEVHLRENESKKND